MFLSPKDRKVRTQRAQMRAQVQSGLPFSGPYDPLGRQGKPFFPTLTKFLLMLGLGFLSWLATYTGMLELIVANAGSVDVSVRIAMAFAVAMLMLMIIYLLDALFSPISWWLRMVYLCGYIFLTLISVGFGFGFYWKYLEARSESTRSAESAVGNVQVALEGGQARLEQLQTTFDSLTGLSAKKAEEERTKGGTCPKSPPGDGPRRRLRDADAKNFAFAGDFVKQRSGSVKQDISALNSEMAKLSGGDDSIVDPATGTRNVFLRTLNKKLDLTITRFNALRTDPQLQQFRDKFAQRADQVVFDNGRGGTFRCPDPQLQLALKGVVRAIDGLPDLSRPTINAVEGSEAIVEAFRRLTVTLAGALTFTLPPSPDELRALQQRAVRSVGATQAPDPAAGVQAGLGKHDFIPFFIAIFVDLCLLLVSINRPVNRMQRLMMSAQDARQAQVHQILSRVHTVHERGRSQRLDALHEVMFDSFGAQYVAVPLDVFEDSKAGPYGSPAQQEDYARKVVQARYLATLMAALEAGGLVTLAPTMPQFRARKKLDRFGSRFSDSTAFRVYRFHSGAWPAIVLDDMLGASAQLDEEAKAHAAWAEAEEDKAQGQAKPSDAQLRNGSLQGVSAHYSVEGVLDDEFGFGASQEFSRPLNGEASNANGFAAHMNGDASTRVDGHGGSRNRKANGQHRSQKANGNGVDERSNGASSSSKPRVEGWSGDVQSWDRKEPHFDSSKKKSSNGSDKKRNGSNGRDFVLVDEELGRAKKHKENSARAGVKPKRNEERDDLRDETNGSSRRQEEGAKARDNRSAEQVSARNGDEGVREDDGEQKLLPLISHEPIENTVQSASQKTIESDPSFGSLGPPPTEVPPAPTGFFQRVKSVKIPSEREDLDFQSIASRFSPSRDKN